MPASIQPDLLRAQLGPLDEAATMPASVRHYQAYYGLALAQRPDVQSRLGWMPVHGYQVVTQLWWPPSPVATLVILHGYYDHMGLYRHVVEWGLAAGFAVLACDLPGHGLSSGPRASINEFAEYQAVLRALLGEAGRLGLPQPWHLLGQSTGGAIVVEYLLHQPDLAGLGRGMLLAPLVRPRGWVRGRLSYCLLRRFVRQIPRRFNDNSGDADFVRFVRTGDPLQASALPTTWVGALARWIPHIEAAPARPLAPLIVQGEQDMTVDWPHNLAVLQTKFAGAQVLRLPTARHHLANEQPALRQRCFDFLRAGLDG